MRDLITSAANPHIKKLRSLAASRKDRRRERGFLVEGVRLVEEALRAPAPPSLLIYVAEQLAQSERGRALLAQLEPLPQAYPTTAQILALVADTVTPQGVLALAPWPELELAAPGLLLVLDRLQDPGNVGTLLRSAEATGVAGVLCLSGTADLYSPKLARAAMGAHFRLPLRGDLEWRELEPYLAGADHVYAAAAEASMPYFAADWRQPCALIVGNEAQGLSPEALQRADKTIAIPMRGQAESLNAAVAGSVMLFEALRQRSRGRT